MTVLKADIIVENNVIIELKAIESLNKAHKKQVLTYLRLTGLKLGYLLNFGEAFNERRDIKNYQWRNKINLCVLCVSV